MTRKILALAATAVLAGVAPAWGGSTPEATKPASGQAPGTEAAMPPAELSKLASWVGTWNAEQHVFAGPTGPESRDKSQTTFRWVMAGMHLEGTHDFVYNGKPMEGRSIWSFDPDTKEYQCYWMDGMSPKAMIYTGNFTPEGNLVVKASYTYQGKPVNDVITYVFPTPDSYSMKYESDVAGTMQPVVEENGTRAKAGSKEAMEQKPGPKKKG
ncbi:MAG TPA: DUF1579 family protein, partial [Candidatus Eisenbacteria bacterium]|jgi:hypothetical protein